MRGLWDISKPGVVAHVPTGRDDWMTLRRRAVTASQAGALLGVHDFTTPLELWAEKSGWLSQSDTGTENPVFLRGELLEDDALTLLARQNPAWAIHHNVIGAGGVYLEDSEHKLGGTPDAFALVTPDERAVVEVKSTDWATFERKWGGKDNPEPPLWIAVQAMLNAHLADAHCAYVIVLVVGRTLDLHTMRVDVIPGLIERLQHLSSRFWQQVEDGHPPDPDYARDGATIQAMLPYDEGTTVDLSEDNEVVDACARSVALKADIKLARDSLEQHEALIRHRMGTHAIATAGGYRITNKRIERKAYTVQATAYRQLRITPPRDDT